MKKLLKITGIILAIAVIAIAIFYYKNNESLPTGKQGKDADALATKMLNALNYNHYKNTEILEWSFRGKHHYRWIKRENIVVIKWDDYKVHLFPNQPEKNMLFNKNLERIKNPDLNIFKQAQDFFNNDSFWLVAPYKIFDPGTERRIVKYNGKNALLITYTSGGSTPGDSYLWILDKNYFPTSFKMWTSIIPIGGVSATWSDWEETETGIKLPTKHKLSLFGMELDMGEVKTENSKAGFLAHRILKAINHDAYKKTRYIEWSFGGRRSYKWDKQNHIINVSWNNNKVVLHPNDKEKNTLFIDGKETTENKEKLTKKAEKLFNNDSFWLVAPHKLFEPGIIRSIVHIDGKEALKVTYTTGGTTPGDSYIWILDNNHLPIKYLMNVPSMKMNQVPATWDDWFVTESGTMLPKNHTFSGGRKLSMGDVKGTN